MDLFKLEEKLDLKTTWILILIAYAFSIAVRFIYFHYVDGISQFYWHHQLMINNVDGYYYMQGARDIVDGTKSYLSPIYTPLALFTGYLAKFLHIDIDTLALYMPGIFGSLVVIPVVLIGRLIGSTFLGFLAALLSGIAWSYYHRTMFGYYDTDLLVVVLPTFAIYFTMLALKSKNIKYFSFAPLTEILMIWWHGGLFNVAVGIFVMSLVYVLFLKIVKKENIYKETEFLFFLIIPLIAIPIFVKIILVLALQFGIEKIKIKENHFLIALIIVFIGAVGIKWGINVLNSGYFTRATTNSVDNLKYFSVVNTVREAGHIDWNIFVHRISGSWVGFIVGVIGYLILLIRFPLLWVSIPMTILGFFALKGGLRFTIFAVPFIALGDAYIAYIIGNLVKKAFINDKVAAISKYVVSFIIMAGFIYPNYKHVHTYIMPTTFNKNEVEVLDKLKHIAKPTDFVMTWWDYGYPIRYYAHLKTFVDGGKHSGDVNYPVSFALTRPNLPSYNMSVLDAYYTDLMDSRKIKGKFDIATWIKDRYKLDSVLDIDEFLNQKITLPKIKEDIYYYLPLRMLNIFPTVAIFSSINLKTGKTIPHFYYKADRVMQKGNILVAGQLPIDLNKKVIQIGRQLVPIKNLSVSYFNKQGKVISQTYQLNDEGLNVILMKSYGKVLILDDFFYNSSYIQMFVLGNYDKSLFKPVIITPYVMVYKLIK